MYSNLKISLVSLTGVFALVGCSNGGGSNNSAAPTATQQSGDQNNNNTTSNLKNYVLIGASGKDKTGAVYACNLDLTNCVVYLGGENGVTKAADLGLVENAGFGSSISLNSKGIFVGARNVGGKKYSPEGNSGQDQRNTLGGFGAMYQFNLDGSAGKALKTSIRLGDNDNLGAAVLASEEGLLIGAPNRKNAGFLATGSLLNCDFTLEKCVDFLSIDKPAEGSKLPEFKANSYLGTSVAKTKDRIYIGSVQDINQDQAGSIIICAADGKNCEIIQPNDKANASQRVDRDDRFGSAIAVSSTKLYVGAVGRDTASRNPIDLGSVFAGDLDGKNFKEILGGYQTANTLKLNQFDFFGSSIAVSPDEKFLYVGAVGRQDANGNRVGSVFICEIATNTCLEALGGNSTVNPTGTTAALKLKAGDSLGSSLAVVQLPEIKSIAAPAPTAIEGSVKAVSVASAKTAFEAVQKGETSLDKINLEAFAAALKAAEGHYPAIKDENQKRLIASSASFASIKAILQAGATLEQVTKAATESASATAAAIVVSENSLDIAKKALETETAKKDSTTESLKEALNKAFEKILADNKSNELHTKVIQAVVETVNASLPVNEQNTIASIVAKAKIAAEGKVTESIKLFQVSVEKSAKTTFSLKL